MTTTVETLSIDDKNRIIKYEHGLHEHGLAYLTICGNSDISQLVNFVKQDKYGKLDSWIREYKHNEYVECSWTGKKIYDPVNQLINRFQNYNKYGDDNGDNGKKFNIGIVSTNTKSDTKLDVKIESDIPDTPNIKIEPDDKDKDQDKSKKDTKKRIRIKKTINKEMIPVLESKSSKLESELIKVLDKIIDKSTSLYTSEESDEVEESDKVQEPVASIKELPYLASQSEVMLQTKLDYPVIKFESPIEPVNPINPIDSIDPKDYKLIDIDKIKELPKKYPENFIAFCKENELKPPRITSNNGKALSAMLVYPHTFWNRKTCEEFVKKFNIPTSDSIQLFNKHSQWGILTNSGFEKARLYIQFPYRLSNKHKMRKDFKFNGTQEEKNDQINKIKATIRADYIDVPNDQWQLGHRNPNSTDNSEENLILQPPIQGKYRDDYLFFDTLTKMPLPNKLDNLLKSKELQLTDEQICRYIEVLNKYKNK